MADQGIFDLSALSDQIATAVAAAGTRVVRIDSADGRPSSGIVWRTGQIVASVGALGEAETFEIAAADGATMKAELVGRDPSTDVVLLKAETGEFADWTVAPTPAAGSIALAVGRGEHSPIAAYGLVAEVGPAWQSMRGGNIDARIRLGLLLSGRSEGGAVVAPDGALIGMAVAGPRRRTLVIPAATVDRAVAVLAKTGYVARGFLGVSLHPLRHRQNQPGVIAVDVEPDSPAEKAGIVVGDILLTWNGEPLRSVRDVLQRLGTNSAGQSVTLGILRGGAANEVQVTVGERRRG